MKKRSHRATSKEAHESVKEHKQRMYEKIESAMLRLRTGGNFEQIAKVAELKPDQVWKRLSELVVLGKVYNTGDTLPTSSGRKAMVRQLTELKTA